MNLQLDAAAPGVLPVLRVLSSALSGKKYYLAGGTALALLESHRISVDIDIFGPQLDDPQRLLHQLESAIEGIDNAALGPGTVYFDDAENDQPLRLTTPVDWDGLKVDFRTWVRALLPK